MAGQAHTPAQNQLSTRPWFRGAWALLLLLLLLLTAQCRWWPRREPPPAVLDVHQATLPRMLDPTRAQSIAEMNVTRQLFAGLTRLSADGRDILPDLATEWKASGDRRIYTFYLRQEAVWVDRQGQAVGPITADDVVWTFRRLCDPTTGAASAPLFYIIEGCEDAHKATGIPDLEGIDVRAVDDFTVEFTLVEPATYFPALLTALAARPLPRALIDAAGDAWAKPDALWTSGPYMVREWSAKRALLVQNPLFFAADEVTVAQVRLHALPEEDALARYDRNQLDMVLLSPATTAQFRYDQARQPELRAFAEPCSTYAGFVTVNPPLDFRLVRLALSEAIDRDRLVSEVLGGNALPARHLTPPGTFGAPPADQIGVEWNPEHAQDVLARAGYPGGQGFPPLTLRYPQNVLFEAVARFLARVWEETLGIEVRLDGRPAETYAQTLERTLPLEEAPHIWLETTCNPSPDAHHWLSPAFHCEESPNRARRLCNAFDALLEQAAVEPDPAKRRELYAQAEDALAVSEVAYAPLYVTTQTALVKPWLQPAVARADFWELRDWSMDMFAKVAAQEE
ncbi:MAG: peptide ABC transporter substrate-binding protein [Ardenticatenia bacterium]|nr:peptide ABC transporter substrate-binding protein [Ardenticatenia bacterium]